MGTTNTTNGFPVLRDGAPVLALVLVLSLLGGGVALGQGRGSSKGEVRHKGGEALSALQAEHAAQKARGRSTRTFTSRNPLLGQVGDWVVIDAVASGSPYILRASSPWLKGPFCCADWK